MRLLILDDLHLEFGKFHDHASERDLTILAGDIGVNKLARNLVDDLKKKSSVAYVMGNHEYYDGTPMGKIEQYWREQDVLLQMDVKEYNGLRVAGCTLWTNFHEHSPTAMDAAQWGMNDFRRINLDIDKPFNVNEAYALNERMVEWLSRQKADVVVTHHAPSIQSIHPKYYNNELNWAYCSDLEWLIPEIGCKLWVHGHVHNSFQYMIGDCRIVCNPRGYMGYEENRKFNPNLIIEV
jgi:predicted phosphodiesterase